GQPLAIPYGPAGYIPRLLDTLDGLVVPGGDYPFPDAWYGEGHPPSPYGQGPSPRAAFEAQITQQALDRPLPCLGICAGMQVMAALLGCRLTGDCRTLVANDHRVPHPERPCHPIVVTPHTRLRALAATDIVQVNSAHREAVAEVAPGVMVGAWAEDGLIEAIELDDHPFAVGVQWHPEYWVAPEAPLGADLLHRRLFEGLVDAAGRA
ncbi:MAG: gamma-glutamyl-gamma-aminobutyrate hydrolase family protein, partial [Candidatus Competibacterales bacterium]